MNGNNSKYFALQRIYKDDILGIRRNCRLFAALVQGLMKYMESGGKVQMIIIQLHATDQQEEKNADMFTYFVNNPDNGNMITKITHGKWTDVHYYSRRWYLCRWENGKRVVDDKPFCSALPTQVR